MSNLETAAEMLAHLICARAGQSFEDVKTECLRILEAVVAER